MASRSPLKQLSNAELEELVQRMREWPKAYHADLTLLVGHLRWMQRRLASFERAEEDVHARLERASDPGMTQEGWLQVVRTQIKLKRTESSWFLSACRKAGFGSAQSAIEWVERERGIQNEIP